MTSASPSGPGWFTPTESNQVKVGMEAIEKEKPTELGRVVQIDDSDSPIQVKFQLSPPIWLSLDVLWVRFSVPTQRTYNPMRNLGPFGMNSHINVELEFTSAVEVGSPCSWKLKSPESLKDLVNRSGASDVRGETSPLCKIKQETLWSKRGPSTATYFAFVYPFTGLALMDLKARKSVDTRDPASSFLLFGGYVYFDDHGSPVYYDGIRPGSNLLFDGPFALPEEFANKLQTLGQLFPVTVPKVFETGACSYGWLSPGDDLGHGPIPHGGFAYLYSNPTDNRYFKLVEYRESTGKDVRSISCIDIAPVTWIDGNGKHFSTSITDNLEASYSRHEAGCCIEWEGELCWVSFEGEDWPMEMWLPNGVVKEIQRRGPSDTRNMLVRDRSVRNLFAPVRILDDLLMACKNRQIDKLKEILPTTPQNVLDQALIESSRLGIIQIVELVLEFKGNVDSRNAENDTPLMVALASKKTLIAHLLLDNGASCTVSNTSQLTPVFLGASTGLGNLLERMLQLGGRAVIEEGATSEICPLHSALSNDHLHCVMILLSHGANKETTSHPEQLTPLLVAAKRNSSAVPLLLQHGCNINATNNEGHTPLQLAAAEGHVAAVMSLLQYGASADSLMFHLENSSLAYVKYYLENRIPRESVDHEKNNQLLKTHVQKHSLCSELKNLLMQNVDPFSLLTELVREPKAETTHLNMVINHGLDLSRIHPIDGDTVLHLCVFASHSDFVRELLFRGADVNIQNRQGLSPLHVAVTSCGDGENLEPEKHRRSLEIIKSLLGVDSIQLDVQDENGLTPLHIAVKQKNAEIARRLIKYGADLDAYDLQGMTALHMAAKDANSMMIVFLLEQGAVKDVKNADGNTFEDLLEDEMKEEVRNIMLELGEVSDVAVYKTLDGVEEEFDITQYHMNRYNLTHKERIVHPSRGVGTVVGLKGNCLYIDWEGRGASAWDAQGPPLSQTRDFTTEVEADLIIPYNELRFKKMLGKGGFGTVWLADHLGTPVAVKILQQTTLLMSQQGDFLREVNVLKGLRRPNIVFLLGATQDPLGIVTEYCEKGDLHGVLNAGTYLNNKHRKECLCEIAAAIAYLHRKQIIHRDLKTMNVLVKNPFTMKVADFGLSEYKSKIEQTPTEVVGTTMFMSPELLEKQAATTKADVYAFAMIMYQVFKMKLPFSQAMPVDLLEERIKSGYRPKAPEGMPVQVQALMERCWAQDPASRPEFEELLEEMNLKIDWELPFYEKWFSSTRSE